VSASGAEERSSSLRGGAFRAMNQRQSQKRTFLHSILTTLQHLFIAGRDPSHIKWILGAITILGMVMRIWKINDPIAYDEAYTFIYFATREFRHILADYSAPNNHILHTILVRISYELFGDRPWIVRLPALLAGTLCIPAAYLAARRILSGHQSLAAAALVALTPWFISYSANGRGYTLLILFALFLANLGALLIHQQSRAALAAYAITAALGFYTIPIFLYPMAGISLWVLATYLTAGEPWRDRSSKAWTFLAACTLAGLMTLLLYSPVIIFGTGLDSIISNEFVESRDGAMFVENLRPRAARTWESWMMGISPAVEYLLLSGFLLSTLFYGKASRQRLPLQLFLVLAIAILLVVQRVVPLARVWMYLEAFYMIFAGAGLVWLAELLLNSVGKSIYTAGIVPAAILLAFIVVFTGQYLGTQPGSATASRDLPEQYAAEYLASHLQAGDKILSIAPVDIQTAYYLYMNGVPYEVFYQRDHPVKVQNAVIVLRTTSKYNTPESVLDFYKITDDFDLASARLIFEYGPLNIFSIPAR
jgi:hypothetical protein